MNDHIKQAFDFLMCLQDGLQKAESISEFAEIAWNDLSEGLKIGLAED